MCWLVYPSFFFRLTKYNPDWEKEHSWIAPDSTNTSKARCNPCLVSFSIGGQGIGQVRSHSNSAAHKKATSGKLVQQTLNSAGKITSATTLAVEVIRAEILQALKTIRFHQSFNSTAEDSNLFCKMFPDSKIASNYHMGATKLHYIINFGIAPYIRDLIKSDIVRSPFTMAFDETTNSQTKKQLDLYLSYLNKDGSLVTGAYVGSKFLGHCPAEVLLRSVLEIFDELEINVKYLIGVNMDGAAVNLKFLRLLKEEAKEYNSNVLDIASCVLHIVNNAFRKLLDQLAPSFDVDKVISDLNFFFKLSSARR
jgi:hypothetical protein